MSRIIALASIALAATPAAAVTQAVPPMASVTVADLDLGRPAGVDQLDQRIRRAVRAVCPTPVTPDLPTALDHRACRQAASRTAAESRARVLTRPASTPIDIAAAR